MRNRNIFFALSVFTLIACNKEQAERTFSPEGFWKGTMYFYSMGIVNKNDGSSQLYMGIPHGDTSRSLLKSKGNYTYTGNSFRGLYDFNNDSLLFETEVVNATMIKGTAYTLTGQAFPFELEKQ